jgi:cytochrome o ubiquinol oxidase subunit III
MPWKGNKEVSMELDVTEFTALSPSETSNDTSSVSFEEDVNDKTFLGFWTYLMTDLLMFAVLFATFAVLRTNTFGGPSSRDITNLPYILVETLILLVSSSICGLAVLSATKGQTTRVIWLLGITFMLGITFLGMELFDFHNLFVEGDSFQRSGFLTAYFSLVGTHGLHITAGLLWMGILLTSIFIRGLTKGTVRKLTLLGIFWHFLDLVWIFIFTIVYLMGVIKP